MIFLTLLSSQDGGVDVARYHVICALLQYRHFLEKAKGERNAIVALQGDRSNLVICPDIVAYKEVKRVNMIVNTGLYVGDVPVVEVGDAFSYCHQMVVLGLHQLPFLEIEFGENEDSYCHNNTNDAQDRLY